MRYIWHPELRNGVGAWGFKGEESDSKGNKKQTLAPPHRWVTGKKFISGNNPYFEKELYLDFSRQLGEEPNLLLNLQSLHCLQFKIVHVPKRHIWGWPAFGPHISLLWNFPGSLTLKTEQADCSVLLKQPLGPGIRSVQLNRRWSCRWASKVRTILCKQSRN